MKRFEYLSIENGSICQSKGEHFDYRRILFLDRDGVIIEDVGHISSANDVVLIKGASSLVKLAKSLNMMVAIVTNQSSVARGIITESTYVEITERMLSLLGDPCPDIIITSFYHKCFSSTLANSSWRKPEPGMFEYVFRHFCANPDDCIMVGDKVSDMVAAASAGINKLFLIISHMYPEELSQLRIASLPSKVNLSIIDVIEQVSL